MFPSGKKENILPSNILLDLTENNNNKKIIAVKIKERKIFHSFVNYHVNVTCDMLFKATNLH